MVCGCSRLSYIKGVRRKVRPNERKKFKPRNNENREYRYGPMTPEQVEKWIKRNLSNTEKPKRGKKNSLGEYKKNKRRGD